MAAKARRKKKKTKKSAAARPAAKKARSSLRRTRTPKKKKRSVARPAAKSAPAKRAAPAKSAAAKRSAPPAAAVSPGWTPPISSDAVAARTGKNWDQWLEIIDAAGGRTLGHPAIAAMLYRDHGVDGWWAQMVTVGYEQARGLRQPHQRPDGFEISGTRVIGAPIAVVFEAFVTDDVRARWMAGTSITVHKATPHKYARATWTDGSKSIAVGFYPKGEAKTQIAIQHGKLADAEEAERMKTFWGQRLDAFKAMLEAAPAAAPAPREST